MFFFIYGVVKKPRYNRNLAISELVVNDLQHVGFSANLIGLFFSITRLCFNLA